MRKKSHSTRAASAVQDLLVAARLAGLNRFCTAGLFVCLAFFACLAGPCVAAVLQPEQAHAATAHAVDAGYTGQGSIMLRCGAASGTAISVDEGEQVVIDAQPADGFYLAQLRCSSDGGKTFAALDKGEPLVVENADVQVMADFVSKVWDGTVDISWFDADAYGPAYGDEGADAAGAQELEDDYHLTYPAQVAGLAALVNGIFNDYPTAPVLKDGVEQRYTNKKGNLEYLNGQVVVRPDVPAASEDGKAADNAACALDTAHLYAVYEQEVCITSLERDKELSGVRTSRTTLVGDASMLRPRFEHTDKNPASQNLTTTTDYFLGSYDFAGKTVHLEADMDFGGVCKEDGTWSTESPLYMPIGGQYCMLPDNGYSKLSSSFCGVLDGGGHTWRNVYCERYANTEYGDSQSIGIVGRLGLHDDDAADGRPMNPTVRNICLESGMVSGRRSTGGIVGKFGKTSYNNADGSKAALVENCVNKASLFATDKKGLGGIVGASWNGGIVQNCANLGAVSHVGTVGTGVPTGGIVGSNEVTVRNCYNAGAISAENDDYAMGVGTRNGDFNHFVSNCWWLTGTAAGGGYYGTLAGSGGSGAGSCTEFGPGTKHEQLVAADLNVGAAAGVWVDAADVNKVGTTSYPALWYQVSQMPDCTLTVQQPEHGVLVVRSAYGTGRVYTSGSTVPYGTMLLLECAPDPGYTTRAYEADGAALDDDVAFVLADAMEIGAQVVEAGTCRFSLSVGEGLELSVTKDGTAQVDGVLARVSGYPVSDGDVLYEGDRLVFTATPDKGAVLEDEGLEYLDSFTMRVGTTTLRNGTYTVTAADAQGTSSRLSASVTRDTGPRSWYTVADVSWYTTHTDDAEYTVSTIEQLAGVAALVNTGSTDFEDKTIHLSADVSAVPVEGTRAWLPIGVTISPAIEGFKGTFDGGGHSVELGTFAVANWCGLFGDIGMGGVVRDVRVCGTVSGGSYIGGVCGMLRGGHVSGCVNEAAVSASGGYATDAGGICGYVDGGTIEGCANLGTVSGEAYVGGIAGSLCRESSGSSKAVVSGCYSTGTVTGSRYVGGLAGRLQGPSEAHHTTVDGCYVAAPVELSEESGASDEAPGALFGTAYRYYDVSCVYWTQAAGSKAAGRVSAVSSAKTSALQAELVGDDELRAGCMKDAADTGLIACGHFLRNATASNGGFPLLSCTLDGAYAVRFTSVAGEPLDALAVEDGASAQFAGVVTVPSSEKAGHYLHVGWAGTDDEQADLSAVHADVDVHPLFKLEQHNMRSEVATAATYAAAGTLRHTCTVCGYQTTSALPKLTVKAKTKLTSKTKSTKRRVLKVVWKKQAKAAITGWQIRVKQGSKTRYVRVKGAAKTSVLVKKLKRKVKCTVKVRAYVKQSGRYYYGQWSAAKKVKVK